MSSLLQWKIETEVQPLYIIANNEGLCEVTWHHRPVPMASSLRAPGSAIRHLAAAASQLEEYFKGDRKKFDLSLSFHGTEFQKKVWQELSRIPYGDTLSYKTLAAKIKKDKAVRAVGSANGKNPFCVIVPCHRVIASDGTLGGYNGGLKLKNFLLDLERK